MATARNTALVLSGGGVRGAYEVGVVQGIGQVLGRRLPFSIFTGTSVGAINATFLAANAHRADLGAADLANVWRGLQVGRDLRLELFGVRRRLGAALGRAPSPTGRWPAVIDPTPLEQVIGAAIDFDSLHNNVDGGLVEAVVVPALHVTTGVTHMFAELSPSGQFRASRDPQRLAARTRLSLDHVMASASIPVFFPPRKVGQDLYYDGGLRFNTPMSPAIRCGADRLVVIAPIRKREGEIQSAKDPDLGFLLGKLLNTLLLDPLLYDLQVLERFNALVDTLEEVLDDDEMARVHETLVASRRAPYRKLSTLVFTPSVDIGREASRYLHENLHRLEVNPLLRFALRRAMAGRSADEADWASWVLFDGELADRLVGFGRQDALDRADEIEAFFAVE